MSTQNLRMSRITHPRASLWGAALLVAVFLSFGAVAAACLPDQIGTPEPTQIRQDPAQSIKNSEVRPTIKDRR